MTTRKVTVSSPLRKLTLWTGFGIGYFGAAAVLSLIIRCDLGPLPLFLFRLLLLALATSALSSTVLLDREPQRFARAKKQWLEKFGGVNPIESIPGDDAWTSSLGGSSELRELERAALQALAKDLPRS